MADFDLKILSPEGEIFRGKATAINVNSVNGYMSVWAHHLNLVTALTKGKATVTTAQGKRAAHCDGGMMSVQNNVVTLLATGFEWEEN